ncbi:MAG: OmpA family protein [Bacteroidetes bacterium]|nr:OmpA family protein [Bacteroidota bacterium]
MKKLHGILAIIIFLFCQCSGPRDGGSTVDAGKIEDPKKLLKTADNLFSRGSYYTAIDYYLRVCELDSGNVYANHQLAEVYYLSRDYANAEGWYIESYTMDPAAYPLDLYMYAKMIKMNGKYDESIKQFERFTKEYKERDKRVYKKLVDNEILGCKFAKEALLDPKKVKLRHLGNTINCAYSDLAPVPMGDTALIYASLRADSVIIKGSNGNFKVTLYKAKKRNNIWVGDGELEGPFNDKKKHTSNGAFSPDSARFYFVRCVEDKAQKMTCSIYLSEFVDNVWQDAEELGSTVNMPGFTSTYPTVGTNKKGLEVLYFVSNRPNGVGGLDIWYVVRDKRTKKFGQAFNARKTINTPADEVTPFYDNENKQLYFSSDGLPGMGGYDVFVTTGMLKKWSVPENLGYPVNSSVDEMYYILREDRETGFIVSNRPGGIALKSETCCDDIYSFRWFNVIRFAIEGIVLDQDDSTRVPMEGSDVSLMLIDSETGEEVFMKSDTTRTERDNIFFFTLGKEMRIKLLAAKKGWLTGSTMASTVGLESSDTLSAIIYIRKITEKAYKIKNIFYDFDSKELREESLPNLDSMVTVLNDNPLIIVEISSHTDSRGSADYNLNLSQKRAESVVKYLAKQGISLERMQPKGYGKSALIKDCSGIAGCPTDESGDCPCHQANRRTEFKIIGELDAPLEYDEDYYDDSDDGDDEE